MRHIVWRVRPRITKGITDLLLPRLPSTLVKTLSKKITGAETAVSI